MLPDRRLPCNRPANCDKDHSSTNGVEHAVAPSAWQSLSLIICQVYASLFMVVRISDVVLLVSWLSNGVIWFILQQGLVALVSQPSESIVDSSLSIECNCFTQTLDWQQSHEFSQHGSSPTSLPRHTIRDWALLSHFGCAVVLNAECDDHKERPSVFLSTSGCWAIISSDNMLAVASVT